MSPAVDGPKGLPVGRISCPGSQGPEGQAGISDKRVWHVSPKMSLACSSHKFGLFLYVTIFSVARLTGALARASWKKWTSQGSKAMQKG